MSGHNYVSNPNNLFEDEDVDDETFLKNSRVNSPHSTNPFEEQMQTTEQKRKEIEQRTLESSKRSLGLLIETEEVGKATAGELSKQREQLENTNRQLDEISATLRFSQKHLNGLKSVFGGLKNYLAGNREMSPKSATQSPSGSGSKTSPDMKIEPLTPPVSPEERFNSHSINRLRSDDIGIQQVATKTNGFDKQLEQNLDEMCGSLSRLKNLATDLKGEIDTQNELLDNMNYKIEDVDLKMSKQNKEMNKLLKK